MEDARQAPLLGPAVIVSANEANARTDRRILRRLCAAGPEIFSSGADALDRLAREPADLVLCDAQLADMTGREFLRLVRRQRRLRSMPVVMVTAERDHETVLDAFSGGCAGYLIRPYSLASFERHVRYASRLSVARDDVRRLVVEHFAAIFEAAEGAKPSKSAEAAEASASLSAAPRFSRRQAVKDRLDAERQAWGNTAAPKPPAAESEARRLVDLGLERLRREQWDLAIEAFNEATLVNSLFAEAWEGLAEAWGAKGDERRRLLCLKKAASAHARFDRFDQSRAAFADILKRDPSADNPYYDLGLTLLGRRDYAGAAHALRQALRLAQRLGRSEPDASLHLAEAVLGLGDETAARDIVVSCLAAQSDLSDKPLESLRSLAARLGLNPAEGRSRSLLPRWLAALVEPFREPELFFRRAKGRLRQEIDQAWLFEGRERDLSPNALNPIL